MTNPEVLDADDGLLPTSGGEAGINSAVAVAQYEIQAASVMAMKNPRNKLTAMTELIALYRRPNMAETATYFFKRAGTEITGPTVKLTRQAVRCYRNMRVGFVTVSIDDKYVHLKGYAYDVENNTRFEQEDKFLKKIQRKVDNVTKWVTPNESQLQELIGKKGAILERNCSLRALPPDLIDDAIIEAKKTLKAEASKTLKANREDAIKALVKVFAEIQVPVEMLEKYLGHALNLVTDTEYANLRTICVSIHDGNTTREEAFDLPRTKEPPQVDDSVKDDFNKVGKPVSEPKTVPLQEGQQSNLKQDSKVQKP